MNKILDIASLEKNFLDKVFDLTATISNDWPNIEQIGAGKTICLLFWEPSTRTKLSFEHAAKNLVLMLTQLISGKNLVMKHVKNFLIIREL